MKRISITEIMRYMLSGGMSSVVYLGTSNGSQLIGAPALVATFLGWVFAVGVAYVCHIHFTYRVTPQHRRMSVRYAGNALFNLIFAEVVTLAGLEWLMLEFWQASLLVVFTLPLFSYPLGKYWAFKEAG